MRGCALSDAVGTEYKELLKALRLLYKHNHIETPQYRKLVADIVSTELDYERITAEESMLILLAHGVI